MKNKNLQYNTEKNGAHNFRNKNQYLERILMLHIKRKNILNIERFISEEFVTYIISYTNSEYGEKIHNLLKLKGFEVSRRYIPPKRRILRSNQKQIRIKNSPRLITILKVGAPNKPKEPKELPMPTPFPVPSSSPEPKKEANENN